MKALVFHDIGDIRLEDVPEPQIRDPFDAVVEITASAICGTDLHMIRGTMPGMEPGTILGHEAVGIVRDTGAKVRNLRPGDRVIIPSTIACGFCSYCRAGYFSQCDIANPHGARAGTCFFGGPVTTGPVHGLQAEYARVPYANIGLVKIPESVGDDQALLLSDIFPTGYFGADIAEIKSGDTVAVFGCGPVGQFAVISAFLMGAGRVIAVDRVPSRLEKAREFGAEAVNFDREDPVEAILQLTGGIGVDRVIDAVGVDAQRPDQGPLAEEAQKEQKRFSREIREIAPKLHAHSHHWHPGNAPSQAMEWEVEVLAKAGTLSIIGVYPTQVKFFPIGQAMNKNLTINMGNCPHRRYIPSLLELVESRVVQPEKIITQKEPLTSVIEAYESFDAREEGWLKVELRPERAHV